MLTHRQQRSQLAINKINNKQRRQALIISRARTITRIEQCTLVHLHGTRSCTKPGAKSCRQPPFMERVPARWPRGCDPNTTLGVECLWGGRGQPPACSPTTAPRQPRRQPHYSPVFDGVFLIDGVGEGGKGERALARGPTMPLSRKET